MAQVIWRGQAPPHPFQQALGQFGAEFGTGFGDQIFEEQQQRREREQAQQAAQRQLQFWQQMFGGGQQGSPFGGGQQGMFSQSPVAQRPAQQAEGLQQLMGQPSPMQTGDTSPFHQVIAQLESGGRHFDGNGQPMRSPAGAIGVMQVMPETGPEAAQMAGLEWDPQRFRNDPQYNARLGEAYYDNMLQQFRDPTLAAAAYNAGPGRVTQWLSRFGNPIRGEIDIEQFVAQIPFEETRNYARRFLERTQGGQGQPEQVAAQMGQPGQGLMAQLQQGGAPDQRLGQMAAEAGTPAQPQAGGMPPQGQQGGDMRARAFQLLEQSPELLADENFFNQVMGMIQPQGEGDQFTLAPGQVRFDAQGQPIAQVPTQTDQQQFITLGPQDLEQLGLPQDAIVQVDNRTNEIHMRHTPSTSQDQRDRRINDLMSRGLDRDRAVDIVDGNVDIEIVPQTGRARLVDRINESVTEIPLGQLSAGAPAAGEEPGAAPAPAPDQTGQTRPQPAEQPMNIPPDQTLWEATQAGTGIASGVIAGLSETLGQVPGVPVGEETIEARTALQTATQDLIRGLAINPRFPVGEMNWLRENTALEPGIFRNPAAMRSRMRQIDQYLRRRAEDAQRDAADPNLPEDTRQSQAQNAQMIRNFLPILGVPAPEGEGTVGVDRIGQMGEDELLRLDPSTMSLEELEAASRRMDQLERQ